MTAAFMLFFVTNGCVGGNANNGISLPDSSAGSGRGIGGWFHVDVDDGVVAEYAGKEFQYYEHGIYCHTCQRNLIYSCTREFMTLCAVSQNVSCSRPVVDGGSCKNMKNRLNGQMSSIQMKIYCSKKLYRCHERNAITEFGVARLMVP